VATALAEIVAWAAVTLGIWLVTLSGLTLPETLFAAGASVPCGVGAWAGRRAMGASWRFRPAWVLWPVPVAVTAVIELGELFRTAVWRPHPGRLKTIELPAEERRLAAGREAAATLALSSTPGTLGAHHDPRENRLVVHELLSLGPDLDSVVAR
jgi:hypothetical protein